MKARFQVLKYKALGGLLLGAVTLAGCNAPASQSPDASSTASKADSHADHASSSANPHANPTPRIPAFFSSPDQAQPLPAVLDPKQFSEPVIVRAYQYAKENPELYAQQPCFCYCDASYQHRSLLDCYASDHSVGCQLCLKEGLLTHKLFKEGKTAAEIRDHIIRGEWQTVSLY